MNDENNNADAEPICPLCGGAGVVRNKVGMTFECRCLSALRNANLVKHCGLPNNLQERPLLRVSREYVMRYHAIKDSGRNWLTLMGRSGSGKTTQACMVVSALVKRRDPVRARIYYWTELVRELSSLRFDYETFETKIDAILEPELVVFDDFLDVIPKADSFEEQVALTLIKRRYMQQAPLIITTELTPDEFKRTMPRHGEAMFGRILEMSDGRVDVASATAVNYRFSNKESERKQ
ncbi:MAG: ATP-binding protein [Thermoguttaceae bacterium]|nr:ATP-binding protein [Thermoguttaceae bacterium]